MLVANRDNTGGVKVVTLLTDFGNRDTYVGQLKGALLSVAPDALIVDLIHDVPPQNVRLGAFHLMAAVNAFPQGTVHLAVVDPGVGTARRAIAVRSARGDHLVGPDNGLLSLAVEKLGGAVAAVELDQQRYWRPLPSATFHGRDIFAPVAGHLARGTSLEELGSRIADFERPFLLPSVKRSDREIEGEVIHVDHYGNLVTNILGTDLPGGFSTNIREFTILGGASPNYQGVPKGQLTALVGSMGLLEIALRDGSAAARIGAALGDPVRLSILTAQAPLG